MWLFRKFFAKSLISGKEGWFPILLSVSTGRRYDKVLINCFWTKTAYIVTVNFDTFQSFNYRFRSKFFNNSAKIMRPRQVCYNWYISLKFTKKLFEGNLNGHNSAFNFHFANFKRLITRKLVWWQGIIVAKIDVLPYQVQHMWMRENSGYPPKSREPP